MYQTIECASIDSFNTVKCSAVSNLASGKNDAHRDILLKQRSALTLLSVKEKIRGCSKTHRIVQILGTSICKFKEYIYIDALFVLFHNSTTI